MSLKVNGQVRQDGDLNQMIWNVPETIAKLSEMVALEAGDVIMTGTPSGVAATVAGDKIECEVEGVGKLTVDHRSASEIALEPQIGPPDAIIAEELLARACDRDPAILEHVGVTGEFKRYCDILFDEHAGEPATIEIAYASQDVLHDGWRKTKRRLVEQDQLGFAHQASADGKHLLLATRECTCGLMAALCQYWKHRIDFRKILFAQAAGTRKHGAHRKIFGHRQ